MRGGLKITMAACVLLAAINISRGQGEIQFANNTSQTPVTFGFPSGPYGDSGQRVWGPASTFIYALYLGPVGSTDLSQMTLVDTTLGPAATSATDFRAGALNGGTLTSTVGGNVSGFTAGATYADEVVGWTYKDGATLSAALNSGDPNLLVGYSEIGQVTANTLPTPAGQVFGTAGGGEIGNGIVLYGLIPEPSIIALIGLGAAALLVLRWRKSMDAKSKHTTCKQS